MRRIVINYTETYNEWYGRILKELMKENIEQCYSISNYILSSLIDNVKDFLYKQGYRPRDGQLYRRDLARRLKQRGLEFSIQTNDILWKYLEYFTDVTDYSKCFDIRFKVIDMKKLGELYALKDEDGNYVLQSFDISYREERYKELQHKLRILKSKYKNDEDMQDILLLIDDIITQEFG